MSKKLADLTCKLRAFRDARDWRRFHTLKNLLVSLNLEAAELLELTQWLTDDELEERLADEAFTARLAEECADVLLYLLMICDRAGIDLAAAADAKIARNDEKYPVAKARGRAAKYTEL